MPNKNNGESGGDAAARLQVLAGHLKPKECAVATTSSPSTGDSGSYPALLSNERPGDDEVDPVETSFFVKGPFTPRSDEAVQSIDLHRACLEGAVPAELRGRFLRIGPNPHFDFRHKPYHVFDGDGMVHSVTFDGGGESATYRNKWVRTAAFEREASRGFSFSIMGEAMEISNTGNTAWMPYATSIEDIGRANTALVWHRNRLMALFEQDKPYEVAADSLETLGRVEAFGGAALDYPTFSAHPKVCPVTGDLVFFGYINGPKEGPWLHYGVVNRDGKLTSSFPVTIPAPVMMHDMAITQNFALFYDYNNMYRSPGQLMRGEAKHMYEHDTSKNARFGVLPRNATSEAEIKWIECFTPSSVFHFANAWEEDDGEHIRIYGSAAQSVDVDQLQDIPAGRMHLWRLNIRTGKCVEERDIAPLACDFCQVPADLIGRRSRFVYAAHFVSGFTIDGVIKFDLENETWTLHRYCKDGRVHGGESMFARRSNASDDDGWLLSFTFGDDRCAGSLDIVDATTMQRVARVAMPSRIPAGFHALWIADSNE